MSPIFHKFKQAIKKILPSSAVDFIIRIKGERMKMIDLSYIKLIREKEENYLTDPMMLETDLLLRLGINNERLNEFPPQLYDHTGYGLLYWQYPNQFSKWLVQLSKYKIGSYFEIGVRHGGTFVITVEYLQKFNKIKKAVGIDIGYAPGLVAYGKQNSASTFLQADSRSEKIKEFLSASGRFDLVLIDGNHEEEFCRHDFNLMKDRANIIVLHDIVSDECPAVKKLWQEIKTNFNAEYNFFEFTDQYDNVLKKENRSYLGFGMAVRKSFM
jgi:cephalosporin hydroxylase